MHPYHTFFLGSLFFLVGVLLASIKQSIIGLALVAILLIYSTAHLIMYWKWTTDRVQRTRFFVVLIILSFLMPIGSMYYTWRDLQDRNTAIPTGEVNNLSAIIVSNPELRGNVREAVVLLSAPYEGKLLATFPRYPRVYYGDELNLSGMVLSVDAESAGWLGTRGVQGTIRFPEATLIAQGKASPVRAWLFGIKERAIETFNRVFPPREAALVAGLTFGERGEFTKDFNSAMQTSGTTHLVALSGYNITILAWAIMSIALMVISRRWAFYISVLAIFAFVVMTGGEASVVRAALMGTLVLFSRDVGKLYDMRNAIMFTAVAMVIENPKMLSFDVGFQLSFFALLGIVYLRPAIIKLLRATDAPGVLSWRENMFTTLSAQLAVLPLLLAYFGNISLVAVVANIIVLGVVPITMGLGFLTALFGAFSHYVGIFLGLLTLPFARFITFAIEWFGSLSPSIVVPFHVMWALVYYCIIVGIIYVQRTRRSLEKI